MDERDYKAINDELRILSECGITFGLANSREQCLNAIRQCADQFKKQLKEKEEKYTKVFTRVVEMADEIINRDAVIVKIETKLKKKDEEVEGLKMQLSAMKIGVDYPKKITELQEQLTKSNEMNERLAEALTDIKNWDDRMEDKWEDQGLRAISALKEYQNSKK